ncbi:hypothetical protein V492_04174 [Pseudogymnoascus sp. VKM F-4246]|nr:hypothetical protein V492_04174 [Pseudogymnoascus sp. VKM F-4246]
MADDDFDIDIYGDTNNEQEQEQEQEAPPTPAAKDEEGDIKIDGAHNDDTGAANKAPEVEEEEQDTEYVDIKVDSGHGHPQEQRQQIKSTDDSGKDALNIPKQAPQQQGVKRKEGSDERPIDPGATTALLISDLHWWNTDDDVRGWINQAQCEDELKDITFSEHKVNGKSKGQAYVEFSSQQAATAAKHKIDTFGEGQQYVKKHVVTYSNPNVNPFKTLPKDAPMRAGKDGPANRPVSGNYNDRTQQGAGNNYGGNFRGRGGYNRGNMNNNMGGGFNRNFQNPGMGGMGGNFQAPMGGFNAGSMGGGQFSGGFNRGGMMNMRGGPGAMRGGRGGMNSGMMGGMPMGGMQMGGMPGAMPGMGGPMNMGMGGGMPGAGFPGMQPHFNPAFFPQNQATGGDWQNPHGAKRPRPEPTGIMNIQTKAFDAAKGDTELIPGQAVGFGNPGYSPPENCECYRRYRFDEHQGPFLALLIVALTLVIIAALLAGLTLAISSLDMTWLQVMSTTGPKRRRHQAEIVSRIKRNGSWFLCSMILASVVCMETLPIIVQSLFGTGWIPVLVSTLAIAIFSELLPQYLIPKQALLWSYYCWPFIWTCMWLTAIISWPLSFMLDRLTLPNERESMYTSEQLAVLIKLHEGQEKHGGHLDPDAGGAAKGALAFGLDGNDERNISGHGALTADHSSYTENSEGGFHGPSSSADTELSTPAQRNISVNHKPRSLKGHSVNSLRTVSSPENPTESAFQLGLDILPGHSSYGFFPFVGEVYDATSYEREIPGLDELPANIEDVSDAEDILPQPLVCGSDRPTASSSYYSSQSDMVWRPQTSEAAEHVEDENARTGWRMNTLPRLNFSPLLAIGNIMSQEIHPREKSFHDDRSLLPSQWRDIERGESENTARRTSFWI